jgi:hypothetical protein
MTHSLTAEVERFLKSSGKYRASEIRDSPALVPRQSGLYGWWFSSVPPGVPIERTLEADGSRLLYVGIAPRKPSRAGSKSTRTLRSRLLNHCRGPIGSSTLRRTLASLLRAELDLEIQPALSGKPTIGTDGEAKITAWLDQNARVAWTLDPEPWLVEDVLISGPTRLPLNIKGSTDPFSADLKRLRKLGLRDV